MKKTPILLLILILNLYSFEYLNYNYKTFVTSKDEKEELKEKISDLRSRCSSDNMQACYEASFYNSAIENKLEYFFTKMAPDYCYKQGVAKACYEKVKYFSKQFYPKYEVLIHDPNNLEMLYFGCEHLKNSNSCKWLSDLFKRINNLNEAKNYEDLAKKYSN